jgi:hypothetical protein
MRNKIYIFRVTVFFFIFSIFSVSIAQDLSSTSETPLYLDPTQSIDLRVEDLLSRMTIEEKIGQMNMPCTYKSEFASTTKQYVPDHEDGTGAQVPSDLEQRMATC